MQILEVGLRAVAEAGDRGVTRADIMPLAFDGVSAPLLTFPAVQSAHTYIPQRKNAYFARALPASQLKFEVTLPSKDDKAGKPSDRKFSVRTSVCSLS